MSRSYHLDKIPPKPRSLPHRRFKVATDEVFAVGLDAVFSDAVGRLLAAIEVVDPERAHKVSRHLLNMSE